MDALLCVWCRKEYAGQIISGNVSHGMCWDCYRKEMSKVCMSGYSDASRILTDVYGASIVSGSKVSK